MTRPSDRAIAQAFWHTLETQGALIAGTLNLVIERARELDATAAPVADVEAEAKRLYGEAVVGYTVALSWDSLGPSTRDYWRTFARRRLSAAPVVVGEVTDAMVSRALDAQPFIGTNRAKRVWQCFDLYEADAKLAMRAALTAALAGD